MKKELIEKEILKRRLSKQINESKGGKTYLVESNGNKFALTENEFNSTLMEAIRKTISEMDWRTYDSASEMAKKLSDSPNISTYEAERRRNQSDAFRNHANATCDKQYGVDKIKQREREEKLKGNQFKHTNGELKRLDKQSNDVIDYYDGKQEYKNGKWGNKD